VPVVAAVVAVAVASFAVIVLEQVLAVPNAAAVYLVGVAAVAIASGTSGAVLTAVLAVIVYDFFFTDPRHTLAVADPGEWLNLLLLLFVAVTVGQLAALQRRRADLAVAREREARALVEVTRALATRDTARSVLPAIAATLAREAQLARAWIALGPDDATERVVADSGDASPPRRGGTYAALHRGAGTEPATWAQVRSPTDPATPRLEERRYRIRIDAGGQALGSIWATRPVDEGPPDAPGTRLLAATADQVARRSPTIASPRRRSAPRSPGRATPSSRRCSSRCRTTSGRRSHPSGPTPGPSWTTRSGSPPTKPGRARRRSTARRSGSTGS
jgi:two-component system sensor histidine kinase KdpD